MTQELMYTSAPRGLKPGSRGFCTVVTTQGMAANLADRLEALSGYRHLYGGASGRTTINQVVAQHVQITVGGRRLQVLSRIHDAGVDYSQRSNKFAHHVVLDARELPSAGPAWLLLQSGFMQSTWDGEPRVLPAGRAIPAGQVGPGVCHAWAAATGDAGWGGVLAATVDARKTATIVIRPGFDPLPLVAESIALLPKQARWGVSFSTYFTRLPPGIECLWRFVVEGTAEAAAARGNQGLVINLCQPLPRAEGGPFVESARTGIAVTPLPSAKPTAPVTAPMPGIDELGQLLAGELPAPARTAPRNQPAVILDEAYELAPTPPPLAPPVGPVLSTLPQPQQFRRKTNAGLYIAVGIAVVAILASAGALAWLAKNGFPLAAR